MKSVSSNTATFVYFRREVAWGLALVAALSVGVLVLVCAVTWIGVLPAIALDRLKPPPIVTSTPPVVFDAPRGYEQKIFEVGEKKIVVFVLAAPTTTTDQDILVFDDIEKQARERGYQVLLLPCADMAQFREQICFVTWREVAGFK